MVDIDYCLDVLLNNIYTAPKGYFADFGYEETPTEDELYELRECDEAKFIELIEYMDSKGFRW